MCDGDYDDHVTELERGWRKARKEHRCFACRETIRAGDRYHVIAQVYDGGLSRVKHCARCWAMVKALLFSDTVLLLGAAGATWWLWRSRS